MKYEVGLKARFIGIYIALGIAAGFIASSTLNIAIPTGKVQVKTVQAKPVSGSIRVAADAIIGDLKSGKDGDNVEFCDQIAGAVLTQMTTLETQNKFPTCQSFATSFFTENAPTVFKISSVNPYDGGNTASVKMLIAGKPFIWVFTYVDGIWKFANSSAG